MEWHKALLCVIVLVVAVVAALLLGACCYGWCVRRCLGMCSECCAGAAYGARAGAAGGVCSGLCARCCGPAAVLGGAYAGGLADDDGDSDGYDSDEPEVFDGGGFFRLKVSDPEYTALLDSKKTVEVRPDRPPFTKLKEGDTVTVVRARPKGDTSEYPGGRYKHDSKIVRIAKYGSLEELLKKETLAKVYPGKTAAEAAERFGMYLPAGTGPKDPVMAIELKVTKGK